MTRTHAQRAADKISRSIVRRAFEREREAMTEDEIDRRIVKAIRDAMVARGNVTMADLERANIPMASVTAWRFARLIQRANEEHPEIAHIRAEA